MPITAVCEYCFKEYQVKSAFAGRTLTCKSCGEQFSVPQGQSESRSVSTNRSSSPRQSRRSASSRGRSKSVWNLESLKRRPVLTAVAAILLLTVIWAVFLGSTLVVARFIRFGSLLIFLICMLLVLVGLVWGVVHAFTVDDRFQGFRVLRWFPIGPVIHGMQYANE